MLSVVLSAGCVEDPELNETSQFATVSTYVSGTCSTGVVAGLSMQIADEIGCINASSLVRFTPTANLQLTNSAVLPYLEQGAKTDLEAVASTRTIQINSAFRTVAQQYLLYRWWQASRCGIAAAATPGRSNHESGRALDVANWSTRVSALGARGWAHDVPGDDVHFDHLASADIRGQDVRAFQRLWNRNNPGDLISVDGAYGPQTESRLRQAPATGFSLGPTCKTSSTAATVDVVSVEGPDRVQPQTRAHFKLTLLNGTDVEWPGTAVLRLAGTTSQLHDASWLSTTDITTLGSAISPQSQGEVSFDVMTPLVTEETPIFEQLVLVSGTTQLGTVNLALTVVPGMEEPTSGEADDHNDQYDQQVSGGCSTTPNPGNGSTSIIFALALLAFVGRRRRRG